MEKQPIQRIQFSVYKAESKEAMEELYDLGKRYNFEVRIFRIEKEV